MVSGSVQVIGLNTEPRILQSTSVDFALRALTPRPARVRAIADEFPKAWFSLEFATGILNGGVGR